VQAQPLPVVLNHISNSHIFLSDFFTSKRNEVKDESKMEEPEAKEVHIEHSEEKNQVVDHIAKEPIFEAVKHGDYTLWGILFILFNLFFSPTLLVPFQDLEKRQRMNR